MSYLLNVTFSLTGYFREDEETKSFVVYCPLLDIYTAVSDRADVEPAMRSAADLFIHVCYDRGILEKVLRERGFKRSTAGQAPGSDFIAVRESLADFKGSFPFEVPLPLVADLLDQPQAVV